MQAQKIMILNNKTKGIYQIKNALIKRIEKMPHKEYYYTFILGNKNYIDEDTWQAYQKNGITHLFAISGMHIAIFVAIINKIFQVCSINKKFKNGVIILFVLFYLCLTNYAPSILRASIFFIFKSLNQKYNLKLPTIKILLYTIIFIIFLNPHIIFNIGFSYSVISTASLIIFSKQITSNNYFLQILKSSLIINIATLPITLYNFYEINLWAFLSGCLFISYVTFILYPLILINFVFPLFSLDYFIKIMEIGAKITSKLGINIVIAKINYLFIICYYLLFFLYIFFLKPKYLLLLAFLILLGKIMPNLNPNYYIYFLDVGQGDSIVLTSKFKKEVIMIDTGGKISYPKEDWQQRKHNYKLSTNTITFLKSIGVTKIDLLIITHGDTDHAQEALNIDKEIPIKKVIINNGELTSLENAIIKSLNVGKSYVSKNFKMQFLNSQIYKAENDNSIVTLMQIYKYKILFTGDISSKVENDILAHYNLKLDFLKLAHHGSKTSNSLNFLKQLNPKIAFNSSGRNNRYNHPSKEVLENLAKLKITLYDTQKCGSITLKINKKEFTIKTALT